MLATIAHYILFYIRFLKSVVFIGLLIAHFIFKTAQYKLDNFTVFLLSFDKN